MHIKIGSLYKSKSGEVFKFDRVTKKDAIFKLLLDQEGNTLDNFELYGPAENVEEFLAELQVEEVTSLDDL